MIDLDQLFNTLNPKTRKGLQQFIQGTAEQYVGGRAALGARPNTSRRRSPPPTTSSPSSSAISRCSRSFLVETAKAVTTIGARKEQLTDLIENANTTFKAIGSQQTNLAQGLKELPVTLRQGNRTFAELPSTFSGADEARQRLEADDQAAGRSCSPSCSRC